MYNLSVFEHSPVGYVVTDSIRVSDGTGLDWAGRGVEMGRPGAGPAHSSSPAPQAAPSPGCWILTSVLPWLGFQSLLTKHSIFRSALISEDFSLLPYTYTYLVPFICESIS